MILPVTASAFGVTIYFNGVSNPYSIFMDGVYFIDGRSMNQVSVLH